jgi:hypothetical protein
VSERRSTMEFRQSYFFPEFFAIVESTSSTSTLETGAVAASFIDTDDAAGAGALGAAAEAGADVGAAAAARWPKILFFNDSKTLMAITG